MDLLTNNPSPAITADGEYEVSSGYRPGSEVVVEVYGTRDGASVQPGIVDPDGNFSPAEAVVTGETEPTNWVICTGVTGRLAIKIADAGASTSLKVAAEAAR